MSKNQLLYGTAWKKERTAALVELALEKGFRGIDTACQPRHYHEPGVGEGLAKAYAKGLQRDEIFLQTKYTPESGQDPASIPYDPKAPYPEQVRQSLQASLSNLQTDYLDSLVLHSPLAKWQDLVAVWTTMEDLVEEKRVRQIGISNCYDLDLLQQLCDDMRLPPAVVQNRFYQETNYDFSLRQYCRDQGIRYQSFWTLTANPHLLQHDVLQKIARNHEITTAQLLFAFLGALDIQPLTGTTSAEHMEQDLAAMRIRINQDEKDAINSLGPFF